jgi:hypothetical protein
MGAPGYFVAAGLFMVAAAVFTGHAANARTEDSRIGPMIGAGFSGLLVVVMIVWGIIASIQERVKGKA